jgi:hypothetical protein
LLGVLSETEQERAARSEEVIRACTVPHSQKTDVSATTKTSAETKGKRRQASF